MKGYIVVPRILMSAVSDTDGKFEIKDLPAGKEMEFQALAGEGRLPEEPRSKGAKVDAKGRFKIKHQARRKQPGRHQVSPELFNK